MTTNTNAALRSAAESALEALEILNGIDTETESVTIHVSDEIAALRAALTAAAAPAAVAGPSEAPEGWRNKFAEAVYADLEAADNQDVPLEEYPARILKALDSIVGPRHPTVIHWRNDAIQACIAIAYKYCRDPESFQYLKQDLQALIFAAPKAAQAQAAVAGLGQETCQSCQGNGEIVTNWERYKHPSPGDRGDEAVAECQDCDGRGVVDAAPTTQAAPQPAAPRELCPACRNGSIYACTCTWKGEPQPAAPQGDAKDGPWKCGNEFLPYHPSASHVEPAYRDGWNACYRAAQQATEDKHG